MLPRSSGQEAFMFQDKKSLRWFCTPEVSSISETVNVTVHMHLFFNVYSTDVDVWKYPALTFIKLLRICFYSSEVLKHILCTYTVTVTYCRQPYCIILQLKILVLWKYLKKYFQCSTSKKKKKNSQNNVRRADYSKRSIDH